MKKILYLMAALAIFAVSCTKPEPVKPSITLSTPADVTVPTDGGIQTVSFSSNVPWTASIDNSNWSVSPTSGEAGTATVKVTAPNNTSEDAIVVKVTLKAETTSQVVTFTQLQKDAMVVDVTSYEAPAEGGKVSVKVKANVEVTATTEADWLTIATATKAAVEKTFDVEVSANEGEAREGTIILSGAGKKVEVTVKQAAFVPYFEVDCEYFEVPKEGGEFTVNINTNVEFTVKDYSDGSFPYQHATLASDGKSVKVVIDANEGNDARTPYIKFTVPAIQDEATDEEGNPTGETKDHEVRVYFQQAGLTSISWETTLPEQFKSGTQLSIAKGAGQYVLYDGANLAMFDPENGDVDFLGPVLGDGTITYSEILNDDAGNFIMVTPAAYKEAFDVYVIPGDTPVDQEAEPIALIHSYFDYDGYGLGHFSARGDVLKDGIVTALIADGPANGVPVTGAYWEIKDGKATTWAPYGEEKVEDTCQPKYITFTTAGEIWIANRGAFAPLGTSAAEGFLYNGYDGTYALQYSVGGTTTSLATIGDWANGVSCIQSGVWGEKTIVAVNNMAWFPYWAIPSVLTIFDATSMAPITSVNILGEGLEDNYMAEPSTCVLFEQDGDALVIYSADGAQGLLQKIVVSAK